MQRVALARETDWDGFRRAARALVLARVPPEAIAWSVGEGPTDALAADAGVGGFNVPRSLVALAETALLAREPERLTLLYRLIWRAASGERGREDADIARARLLSQAVRRDAHRMASFLRFREAAGPEGPHFIGWYEPAHFIVEPLAIALARAHGADRFSILTPDGAARWDGRHLALGPGADPAEAADDGALAQYWARRCAAATGPAWRNIGLDGALPLLIGETFSGTEAPVMRAPRQTPLGPVRLRSPDAAADSPLDRAAREAAGCRRCELWGPATQTVFGEGPASARIMFVGEQPGDQEDLAGRPFVGPAGQLLDRALEEVGIDRRLVYVTNAVKHFKFIPRGRRRIHQTPEAPEIIACKPWLDREREAVNPDLIVLLGASASRAVLGRPVTIGRERGRRLALPDGRAGIVTVHPSFLLRVPDEAAKAREYRAFVADLTTAARIAAEIEPRR